MNLPTFDNAKTVMLAALVAGVAYLLWKASQKIDDAADFASNYATKLGDTVKEGASNFMDGARAGAADVLGSPGAMLGVSTSQMNMWRTTTIKNIQEVDPDVWASSASEDPATDFGAGVSAMSKPSYGELSQPVSDYRND